MGARGSTQPFVLRTYVPGKLLARLPEAFCCCCGRLLSTLLATGLNQGATLTPAGECDHGGGGGVVRAAALSTARVEGISLSALDAHSPIAFIIIQRGDHLRRAIRHVCLLVTMLAVPWQEPGWRRPCAVLGRLPWSLRCFRRRS